MLLLTVIAIITVALVFDYINGFHDAANSIATVVSTRVLSPGQAVVWAAFFNFVAAFTFGTAVAKTIGNGMIDLTQVTFAVIFAGLFAGTPDPLEVMKWKEIYDTLERALDQCQTVANVLESISLKNS